MIIPQKRESERDFSSQFSVASRNMRFLVLLAMFATLATSLIVITMEGIR